MSNYEAPAIIRRDSIKALMGRNHSYQWPW
jgi:hypothetical protein